MDWVDTTDDGVEPSHALRQPFEVLRPVPTQATARVQKVQTGKGKDKHAAVLQGKFCTSSYGTYGWLEDADLGLQHCRQPDTSVPSCLSRRNGRTTKLAPGGLQEVLDGSQ